MRRLRNSLLALVAAGPFVAASGVTVEMEPIVFAWGARVGALLDEGPDERGPWQASPLAAMELAEAAPQPTEGAAVARRRRLVAPARTLHVSAERVLAIANAGLRPTGTSVPAVSVRPAGIVVSGVSVMGVGIEDGDVLTHVEGIAVSAPGEVVALVLGARAHHAGSMLARLFRGAHPYAVVVDMPYVEPEPTPIAPPVRAALRGATALRE